MIDDNPMPFLDPPSDEEMAALLDSALCGDLRDPNPGPPCEWCRKNLPARGRRGPVRRYHDACRQAALRARRAQ
jgi:hypothetical protein